MNFKLIIGIVGSVIILSGVVGIIIYKQNQSRQSQPTQTVQPISNQTDQETNSSSNSSESSTSSQTSEPAATPTVTSTETLTKPPTETPTAATPTETSTQTSNQQDTSAVAGEYWCRSYNVDGAGGSCQLQQRLTLGSDGSYQFGSSSGTFTYFDNFLTFTGDLASRGPATYTSDKEIRWEFTRDNKPYTITYYFRN